MQTVRRIAKGSLVIGFIAMLTWGYVKHRNDPTPPPEEVWGTDLFCIGDNERPYVKSFLQRRMADDYMNIINPVCKIVQSGKDVFIDLTPRRRLFVSNPAACGVGANDGYGASSVRITITVAEQAYGKADRVDLFRITRLLLRRERNSNWVRNVLHLYQRTQPIRAL
jgi:hypothetical protein